MVWVAGSEPPGTMCLAMIVPLKAVFCEVMTMADLRNDRRDLTVPSAAAGLSELPASLTMRIEHDLAIVRQSGQSVAVFVVRIDDHAELSTVLGDRGLAGIAAKLARRLRATARVPDMVMQYQADRLVVVQFAPVDAFASHRLAKEMLHATHRPMTWGEHEVRIDISVGIAFFPGDGDSAAELIERANATLARTDKWGGKGFCFYSRTRARTVADGLSLDQDLKWALQADTLDMRFQPIFDIPRQRMVAVSGDIGWRHPERGLLRASDLMPSARRANLVKRLSEWMLDRLCRQATRWERAGLFLRINVEVCRQQLAIPEFIDLVAAGMARAIAPADRLEISVDHRLLLDETGQRFRANLVRLADLGIGLTVANVGPDPIAIDALTMLPIQTVELAPSTIAAIGSSLTSDVRIDALITLAHRLGLKVRAAGTTTAAQADFLQRHGCDEAVGPLLAPALAAGEIDRLARIDPPCLIRPKTLGMVGQGRPCLH